MALGGPDEEDRPGDPHRAVDLRRVDDPHHVVAHRDQMDVGRRQAEAELGERLVGEHDDVAQAVAREGGLDLALAGAAAGEDEAHARRAVELARGLEDGRERMDRAHVSRVHEDPLGRRPARGGEPAAERVLGVGHRLQVVVVGPGWQDHGPIAARSPAAPDALGHEAVEEDHPPGGAGGGAVRALEQARAQRAGPDPPAHHRLVRVHVHHPEGERGSAQAPDDEPGERPHRRRGGDQDAREAAHEEPPEDRLGEEGEPARGAGEEARLAERGEREPAHLDAVDHLPAQVAPRRVLVAPPRGVDHHPVPAPGELAGGVVHVLPDARRIGHVDLRDDQEGGAPGGPGGGGDRPAGFSRRHGGRRSRASPRTRRGSRRRCAPCRRRGGSRAPSRGGGGCGCCRCCAR